MVRVSWFAVACGIAVEAAAMGTSVATNAIASAVLANLFIIVLVLSVGGYASARCIHDTTLLLVWAAQTRARIACGRFGAA